MALTVRYRYTYSCDACKTEHVEESDSSVVELPKGWDEIGGQDLCGACLAKVRPTFWTCEARWEQKTEQCIHETKFG